MDGWERFGIELPGSLAQTAVAKYHEQIHVGTIEDSSFEHSFFDVITLQDVFDHVRDPLETLRLCHRMLKPSGLIVIKVHDIQSLFARLCGPRYYAIAPPYHLSYFNKKSLSTALETSGFTKISHSYMGHILMLKTIPYRLSKGDPKSFFYLIFQILNRLRVGNIRIYKNLYDIITVFGRKTSGD